MMTCRLKEVDVHAGLTWAAGLPPEQMEEGVRWAQAQHDAGRPVYTYCTHGHSRSAVMVCAILIAEGLAHDLADARSKVEERRPGVRPNKRQWRSLDAWFQKYHHRAGAADEGASAAEQDEGGGGHGQGRKAADSAAPMVNAAQL